MLRRAKHIELGKYNHPDESLKIKTKPAQAGRWHKLPNYQRRT